MWDMKLLSLLTAWRGLQCLMIHDIKVIEGEKGLFIAMPSRKANDGEYRDIAHPINSATRENIQNMILEKYKTEIENV